MPVIYIDVDKYEYPEFSLVSDIPSCRAKTDIELEITPEQEARIRTAFVEFDAVQELLQELLEKRGGAHDAGK
jgi:hypothetical protein